MDEDHGFVRHAKSGEVYAVEYTNGDISGVCGPLHHSEVRASNLGSMHYTSEDADWLNNEPSVIVTPRDEEEG